MKKLLLLLLSMSLLVSLAACGVKETTAQPTTQTATEAVKEEIVTEPVPTTQWIVDALGREVEVPIKVERIVTIGNTQRLATYLGVSEKVVGATKVTADNMAKITPVTPFAYVNKDLWADLRCVGDGNGDDVYPEEILALAPDVILCASISEEAVLNLAKQTGMPVVYVAAETIFTENFNNALLIMGKTCGVEARAQEIVDYLDTAMADLDNRTKDVADADKQTALSAGATFRGSHGIEGVRLQDPLLDAIHANNVAAELFTKAASAEVDREQIIAWDPDVIFCDYSGVQLIQEDYKTNAAYYEQLSAFRDGKMYQHPNNTSFYGNLELPVANAYYMGTILYPQQFTDIDIVEKINEVMQFFVGVDNYYSILEECGAGYGEIHFGA